MPIYTPRAKMNRAWLLFHSNVSEPSPSTAEREPLASPWPGHGKSQPSRCISSALHRPMPDPWLHKPSPGWQGSWLPNCWHAWASNPSAHNALLRLGKREATKPELRSQRMKCNLHCHSLQPTFDPNAGLPKRKLARRAQECKQNEQAPAP